MTHDPITIDQGHRHVSVCWRCGAMAEGSTEAEARSRLQRESRTCEPVPGRTVRWAEMDEEWSNAEPM